MLLSKYRNWIFFWKQYDLILFMLIKNLDITLSYKVIWRSGFMFSVFSIPYFNICHNQKYTSERDTDPNGRKMSLAVFIKSQYSFFSSIPQACQDFCWYLAGKVLSSLMSMDNFANGLKAVEFSYF